MPRIDHQLAPNYGPPLLPLIDQNGITPHRKWRRMFAVIDQKKKKGEEEEGSKNDGWTHYAKFLLPPLLSLRGNCRI